MQVISGSDWSVGLNNVSRNTLMDKHTLDKLGLGLRGLYQDLTREPVPEFLALFIRELNHVYFEKRSFSSSGSSWSLTQRRSAMTKGSRFRRASKSPTRRVRSSALAWQW